MWMKGNDGVVEWQSKDRKMDRHLSWKDRHKDRSDRNLFNSGKFLAWDGEATNIDGEHTYFLLMNSDGNSIVRSEGLRTLDILRFLWEEHRRRYLTKRPVIHAMFASGYDVNMWLASLGRDEKAKKKLEYLRDKGFTYLGRYKLGYTPGKVVTIKDVNDNNIPRMQIWDTFGYFQMSFVRALNAYYGDGISSEVLETIESGKNKRSIFKLDDMEEIKRYCKLECEQLASLMETVREYVKETGLTLSRWDGAGSVAGAMYAKHHVKKHIVRDPQIEYIAQHAYAGGRIECVKYGVSRGPVYVYDINSAYPAIIAGLSGLSGGWEYYPTFDPNRYGYWLVEYDFPKGFPIYPFFYRSNGGAILFPPQGSGWHTTEEVKVALKHWGDTCVNVVHGWTLNDWGERPFEFVRQTYEQRKEWKREGRGAEKILKLGLNSLYGKMAQKVGYQKDKPPAYNSYAWAAYVTGATRAALYDAAMQEPYSIVYLATDGICTEEPLALTLGSGLGEWECTEYAQVLSVQSGVYWLYSKDGGLPTSRFRGFDAGQLTPEMVLRGWKEGKDSIVAPSTRFVTFKYALRNGLEQWRTWPVQERELSIVPGLFTKRVDKGSWKQWQDRSRYRPLEGLVSTDAKEAFKPLGKPIPLSKKAHVPWNDGAVDEYYTPKGTFAFLVEDKRRAAMAATIEVADELADREEGQE